MIESTVDISHGFIDLYAGCGGMSLGMMTAKMKCIAAMEMDPAAARSFWYNLCLHGWSHLWVEPNQEDRIKKIMNKWIEDPHTQNVFFDIPEDDWLTADEISPCLNLFMYNIRNIEPQELMSLCGIESGKLGALVGGPPCQGFSTANSNRSVDDKRNELAFRFWHYAKVIQPKFVIMENVPGILTMGKKKHEKEGPFPRWLRAVAEESGYHFQYEIHDAAHYGVPQRRRRVIFTGVRKDLYDKGTRWEFTKPTHTYNYFKDAEDEEEQNQLSLFDSGTAKREGEPYVTTFEAIGDLMNWKLSGTRKEDAAKLPFGHKDRIGNGDARPGTDKAETYVLDGYRYYADQFNGIYFMRNSLTEAFDTNKNKEHYRICPECGKYNIKVRKNCHYCKYSFSGLILVQPQSIIKS